ncbi:MAG: type III-A CRISPR-associated RAMP protein Csm4 [Candidatus Hydrogenedentes bacterium]|nr:type III-A CRISPR-associated RAMP protein Csm4 [Candidatus Hydrogenedentota bacterium]
MTVYRVEIEPRAPIHQGIHGHAAKSGAVVHSDTLHAALMAVAAATGEDPETLRELRLSSLFPCLNSKSFFPKPFLPLPEAVRKAQEEDPQAPRKRWKKAKLVTEKVLNAWFLGKTSLADCEIHDGVAMLKEEYDSRTWPKSGLLKHGRHTGVVVDRDSAAATPYDRNMVYVNTAEKVGLYCLVETDRNKTWLKEQFEKLGWAGLGGNRSSGLGGFEVTACTPRQENSPARANMFMTLSLYLPTEKEVEDGVLEAPAAYDCALRGGWIHGTAGTAHAKHALRMCVEGSVFRNVTEQHGEVRDVTPEKFEDHRVWRSGLAFALPFSHTEEDSS